MDPPREITTRSKGTTACESPPPGNTFLRVRCATGPRGLGESSLPTESPRPRDGGEPVPVVREVHGGGLRDRGELRRGRPMDEAEDPPRHGRGEARRRGCIREPIHPRVSLPVVQAPPAVLLTRSEPFRSPPPTR